MNMGKPGNTKTWTKKIENHREITKNLVRKYLLCSFKLEANLSTKYVSNYTQILNEERSFYCSWSKCGFQTHQGVVEAIC